LILQHQGAGAKHAFFSDGDMIADRDVHAHETPLSDAHAAGYDNLRSKKDIILDDRVVTDMVTAPQRDVGADTGEGLERIAFENEAVLLRLEAGKDRRAAAQIRHKAIAFGAGGGDLFGANGVQLGVADRDK
jgi:hypothetical protein